MEISFSFPPAITEQAQTPLEFLQLCMGQDSRAGELGRAAAAKCSELRDAYPDREDVFRLSGLVCHFIANPETAKRFLAKACLLDASNQQARSFFDMLLANDPDWPSADHYIETQRSAEDAIAATYMEQAWGLFDGGRIADADYFIQRVIAYNHPEMSQSDDVNSSRQKTQRLLESGQCESAYADARNHFQAYWARNGSVNIDELHRTWSAVPIRVQLSKLIAKLLQQSSADTINVFEAGCFAGLNLAMIEDQLPEPTKRRTRFTGVEPNAEAVKFAAKTYPGFRFVRGSLEDVYSRDLGLPERFDICLVSSVFIILDPETVRNFLGFLSARTEHLVICDDIMNVDGEMTVLRDSMNTFIHNFRQLLTKAGFQIDSLSLATQPERDRTGFIVASSIREN